jgi:hypothetical protein
MDWVGFEPTTSAAVAAFLSEGGYGNGIINILVVNCRVLRYFLYNLI